MENNNKLEVNQKCSSIQLIANQQNILNLAKDILSNTVSLSPLENSYKLDKIIGKPIVRTIFKTETDIQLLFGVVGFIVQRFFDSLGFSAKVSPIQVEIITTDAIEQFQYETFDDIILFFKYCRQGKFGTTHRGVDSNLLFGDWYPKYLELKAQEREKQAINERKATDDTIHKSAVAEFYKKHRENKIKQQKYDEMILEIDKACELMDRQELEDTIADWSTKEEMKIYIEYLKKKRLIIKK